MLKNRRIFHLTRWMTATSPKKVSPSETLRLLDLTELSLLQQNSNQMENLAKVQSLKEAFTSAHRSSLAQTTLDKYFHDLAYVFIQFAQLKLSV